MAETLQRIYAVMDGDRVINIVVADSEFATSRPDHVPIDGLDPRPGPGWFRVGKQWLPPTPPEPRHHGLLPSRELNARIHPR